MIYIYSHSYTMILSPPPSKYFGPTKHKIQEPFLDCWNLGCTDAAKWPPHPRPTRWRAGDAAAWASNCVQFFFFFSFPESRRLTPIRLRRAPIRLRRAPICADSGRFESYRPNTGVFRPEKGNRPAKKKKKKKLKTENTNGFDMPLSPSSLARTPFFFFFFFFASSPSSSFFLASPAFQFLLFL